MGERADDLRSQDPEEIQADIARTREDMGETIDEIQERLNPSRLQEQATERVREATIGRVEHAGESVKETGISMWETIRHNPIPAAMVGVGLGWLYMSRGDSGSRGGYQQQYPYGQTRMSSSYSSGEMQRSAEQARDSAMEQAQELGGQVRDRTEQMSGMAQSQMQSARGQFDRMFSENPLALGLVAFGAGALIGLSIPETEQEHQLMGEQRDQLLDRARETAQDTFERAERVAEHTVEEARAAAEEEAEQQGLRE